MEIPKEAFDPIIKELIRKPLEINKYRYKSGTGKSQTFGIVNRRCLPPDYSRQCWLRPYLYKLLLEFGEKYVPMSFNAITVNQDYKAEKHRDKHNLGNSFLVAFGDFQGGELVIHEGDLSGTHNIQYKPIITDFSKIFHSVNDFTGNRYSLVFYTLTSNRLKYLPPPSIREENDKFFFYRGEEKITNGLPHPLKKENKKISSQN
jgi:hypothetical protein